LTLVFTLPNPACQGANLDLFFTLGAIGLSAPLSSNGGLYA